MKTPLSKPPATPRVSLFGRVRAYFFTGLAVTAPIAITIWATLWFVNIFDRWLQPYIPTVYNPNSYLPFNVPGFGLIFALISITLIGALAANLVGRTLISIWEKLLNRTPVVRSIYKGSKQIFETLFLQKGASFEKVCLVEWPRKGIYSLAFISRDIDGAMIGLERSILPSIAEQEFHLAAKTSILSFIIVFGLSKALMNYFAGHLSDKYGRKIILVGGWLVAVPVPFLLMWAPSWSWVLFANVLLGISQGLTWSTTVIMKIDLAGAKQRGLQIH